jgi:hypothetical protein
MVKLEQIAISNHNHENIEELWQESSANGLLKALKEGRGVKEIMTEKVISEAFKEAPCCLGCSDGRIHEHRLGRAGMGILAGVEAVADSLKARVDKGELPNDGLRIASHSGCGAAKIVCDKLVAEGQLPAGTDPDSLGVDFAKKVVVKLLEKGIKAGDSEGAVRVVNLFDS